MAVIQDLPPEVLYRILELQADSRKYAAKRARFLVSASLVARDWRAPAQILLVRTIETRHDRLFDLDEMLERLCGDPNAASQVRRVELSTGYWRRDGDWSKLLGLFSKLRVLKLEGSGDDAGFDAIALPMKLLKGVQHLHLSVNIIGAVPSTILQSPVALNSLEIAWGRLPDSVLQPLLASAPLLRRLTIIGNGGTQPEAYNMEAFHGLAPQLSRLSLKHNEGLGNDRTNKIIPVTAFLAKCTSLSHLLLDDPPANALITYITALPAKITELETLWLGYGNLASAAEALMLPALAGLQR